MTIALRLLTFFEVRVRATWEEAEVERAGLYEGQPKRKTSRPTARRLLKAIARMEITATCVTACSDSRWYVSPLPALLLRILKCVNLSPKLYTGLGTNSG